MPITEKLEKIAKWYAVKNKVSFKGFKEKGVSTNFQDYLDGIKCPELFELYSKRDGEEEREDSSFAFRGEQFLSLTEIKRLVTPVRKAELRAMSESKSTVDYECLNRELVDKVISDIPIKRKFGLFKKRWYKIAFDITPHSFGGPYVYYHENSDDRETVNIDTTILFSKYCPIAEKIWQMDKSLKNGDQLFYEVKVDHSYSVRKDDFESQMEYKSTPAMAIKLMNNNSKWIPIFSDGGGNYIGLDFDPEENGAFGQVITFGRDEEHHFVLAKSLNELFDKILIEIDKGEEYLLQNIHLHELLKEI